MRHERPNPRRWNSAAQQRPALRTSVPVHPLAETAAEQVARLATSGKIRTFREGLDLHAVIASGGMGTVRLGIQQSLGRPVAVKTLHEDSKCDRGTAEMLHEAWITGSLEHPNIVPVYNLVLDDDDSPMIVLKKIDGTSWVSLMHDADTVRERFCEDLLEWNVRILLQVCNAVHFAHTRGIIHRDLKPENVMIGEYGEVYVVDWGIAVALIDDGTGRFPLAKDAKELAGTPAYMAPEMLGGRESQLSERTDVYLLGAILYEIVAGDPPHDGETLMELLPQILVSQPELPGHVPPELAVIIHRAMHQSPSKRYETVELLRRALQRFLRHLDAVVPAQKADRHLQTLEDLLGRGQTLPPTDPALVRSLCRDAHFAFRYALEIWPGCVAARDGLRRVLTLWVGYELESDRPDMARTVLRELENPPAELLDAVDAAVAQVEDKNARRRARDDDEDPSGERRVRAVLALIVTGAACALPLLEQLWLSTTGTAHRTYAWPLAQHLGLLMLALVLGVRSRAAMMRTRVNRAFASLVVLSLASGVFVHGIGSALGHTDVLLAMRHQFVTWAVAFGLASVVIDRYLAIPAIAYLAAYLTLALVPNAVLGVLSLASIITLFTLMRLWLRRGDLLPTSRRSPRLPSVGNVGG